MTNQATRVEAVVSAANAGVTPSGEVEGVKQPVVLHARGAKRRPAIAHFGFAGYGNDPDPSHGNLPYGIGKNGYDDFCRFVVRPLLQHTECKRILWDRPFWNKGENRLPFNGLRRLLKTPNGPKIVASFEGVVRDVSLHGVEQIIYLGSAVDAGLVLDGLPGNRQYDIGLLVESLYDYTSRFNGLTVRFAFDEMSALYPDDAMTAVLAMRHKYGVRDIMEQRPRTDQYYFYFMDTITTTTERRKQEERGGEPSLIGFSPRVENIMVISEPPPDRDPAEPWHMWLVDHMQALWNDGFTPTAPVMQCVQHQRWDLLHEIFKTPAEANDLAKDPAKPASAASAGA